MKKIKPLEGDIFVLSDISLDGEIIALDQKYRLGKVIFISKMTKFMIAIVVSENIFETIPTNSTTINFSNTIFYTGSQLLKNGMWQIIGNQPVTDDEKKLTLRVVGSSLYLLDEYLGVVESNERKKYKKQLISGLGALYYKINELP